MAYVPGFQSDVFISYASEDNVDRWVERFEEQLTAELGRLLGRYFSAKTVYLDKRRITVGQHYPSELVNAARGSAVLVPLMSQNYLDSDWCSRERQVFQERLPEGASATECIAAVRVRPPVAALPQVLRESQRIDFVIPGFLEPWDAGAGKWIELVHKLAAQMKPMLEKLRMKAGAVYIGTPLPSDLTLRHELALELADLHFRATPDSGALLEDSQHRRQALAEAACAVHFIGGATDEALEAIEDSVELCPGKTVLFQPFGVELTETEKMFLADLKPYPYRAGSNRMELKRFLEDLLTQVRRAAEPVRPASLALVCEPEDFGWAAGFHPDGLAVDYPRFLREKLTNMERVKQLRRFVKESHGLLFYHGQSEEERLERVRGMAHKENAAAPLRWYLAEPGMDAKRARRPGDPLWAEGLEEFLEEVRRHANAGVRGHAAGGGAG